MNSAARSSASPPISPIMTMASVSGSFWNAARASMCVVPMIGSPPMPTQVEKPMSDSSSVSWEVSVPDLLTRPMRPEPVMSAGMMPALLAPGEATPGQLGPMMRVLPPLAVLYAQNAAESCTGMPSVMTMASGICASIASMTADLVNAGGTKMTVTSAPVFSIASATVPKTGSSVPSKSTVVPALRGFTPPTMFVPAFSMRRVCLEPSEPVTPWTMTLESLVSQMAMSCPHCCCWRGELSGALGGAVHRVDPLHERIVEAVQDGPAGFGIVAVQAYDQRLGDRLAAFAQQRQRLQDAVGDRVARGDAAEDVDEHALDSRVGQHDLQAVRHHLGARAAADVQEVGRLDPAELLTGVRHHVQCGHDQARAVADDADLAVELDVVEVLGLGRLLQRVDRRLVLQRLVIGVAEAGVLVERDLGVQAEHPALSGLRQRVDLDQGRVLGDERLPQLHRDVGDLVGDVRRELGGGDDLAGDVRRDADRRVDRPLHDLVGRLVRDLLDLHAAGDAGDAQEGPVGPVQ